MVVGHATQLESMCLTFGIALYVLQRNWVQSKVTDEVRIRLAIAIYTEIPKDRPSNQFAIFLKGIGIDCSILLGGASILERKLGAKPLCIFPSDGSLVSHLWFPREFSMVVVVWRMLECKLSI